MTEDESRQRRHIRALAAVNRQLHAQLEATSASGPRSGVGAGWVDQLREHADDVDAFLARLPNGVKFVVEGEFRRPVRSGIVAAALEQALGDPRSLPEDALEGYAEGPPVEVLEGPSGAPFVIVGGKRLPLRGLPLPHPVGGEEMQVFPQGPELNVGAAAARGRPRTVRSSPNAVPLPTFLIIGAQKAATRWLRLNLGRHPEIFMAAGEPAFFSNDEKFRTKGIEWYQEQFDGWAGEPIVGESTPSYLMWQHHPDVVAERIHDTIPDVRLIAILRNPIDRAMSAMVHHVVKERLTVDADLLTLLRETPPEEDLLGLVSGGWYAAALAPYIDLFGEQLLILLHDDILEDPAGVYAKALEHLGATPSFEPAEIAKVRFSNEASTAEWRQELTVEQRREVFDYFRDDVAELEKMLGIDLSRWEPGLDADHSSDVPASE
jgi:hypothetical protein